MMENDNRRAEGIYTGKSGRSEKLLWTLCEIPAPSHHEERRAAFIKDWLEKQGAEGVFIDEAKNVIYPYHYEDGQTTALFMAHTDTVFPDMEPMGVRGRRG